MQHFLYVLNSAFADDVAFWMLQAALAGAFVLALIGELVAKRRAGRGSVTLRVGRGPYSMAIFFGTYLAISGLLVAICLQVDVIESYRIFWVLFDTSIPFYVCVLNSLSRNVLLGWADKFAKLEVR